MKNLLPELSIFLKYGLIGFGAIITLLSYLLLRYEQKKSKNKSSTIKGIYAFMGLGVILVLIGLVAPFRGSKQEANTVLEGSNHNTVSTKQSQGDSVTEQRSITRLSQSDSNKVETSQSGGKDSVKID